jgi:hypothetical protein
VGELDAAGDLERQAAIAQLKSGEANAIDLPVEDPGDAVDGVRARTDRKGGEQRAGVAAQRPKPLADKVRWVISAAATRQRLQPER